MWTQAGMKYTQHLPFLFKKVVNLNVWMYNYMCIGRLNVGDQLLVCDGVSLLEVTHDEAAQALKDAMDMESVRIQLSLPDSLRTSVE